MSLPPILRDNSTLLNSSFTRMPTSSAARKSKTGQNSGPPNGGLPSRSNTSVGEMSSSKNAPQGRPPFLSERQMSVLGLAQDGHGGQKRGRTRSRMTTGARISGSNTDISSSIHDAKLTRVCSEQRLVELQKRHRNLSDTNLMGNHHNNGFLSRSLNRPGRQKGAPFTPRTTQGPSSRLQVASTTPRPDATGQEQEESDSEDEREERIIEWLLGVEDADAETEQLVVEEPPRQTDTAIHVVYQDD